MLDEMACHNQNIPVEDEEQDESHQMHLLDMPNEVLETICCHLDMQSLCSISQTCLRLHLVEESDRVWRAAFYKRFVPTAMV